MSVIPEPWQPLVNNADMVGIVECVTSGEIVARYRVVESWKGPREGAVLTIRGPASVYEPSLPIVFCGDRIIIAAWKWRPEYRLASGLFLSYGPGGSLPPFWRDDHPDYFIPGDAHWWVLSPDDQRRRGEARAGMFDNYPGNLDEFRRDVKSFLTLPDEAREATVLRTLISWHLEGRKAGSTIKPDSALVSRLVARSNTVRVDSIVSALGDFVEEDQSHSSVAAFRVLATGAGPHALASLPTLTDRSGHWYGSLRSLTQIVRRRLGLDPPEGFNPIAVPSKPTEGALDSMRALVRSPANPDSLRKSYSFASRLRKALETLPVYDPEFMSSYLVEWTPGARDHGSDGYALASFFAWRCSGDRPAYLRRLLSAKDPYVRVAGAIYLSFEDEREGTRALRSMMELEGDPGAWAALNLARRGDHDAASRAIDVFLRSAGPTIFDRLHLNLQKRLLVLFSNAAAAGGIPQPEHWRYARDADDQVAIYENLLHWWEANAPKLKLRDPWFADWKRQKVE